MIFYVPIIYYEGFLHLFLTLDPPLLPLLLYDKRWIIPTFHSTGSIHLSFSLNILVPHRNNSASLYVYVTKYHQRHKKIHYSRPQWANVITINSIYLHTKLFSPLHNLSLAISPHMYYTLYVYKYHKHYKNVNFN